MTQSFDNFEQQEISMWSLIRLLLQQKKSGHFDVGLHNFYINPDLVDIQTVKANKTPLLKLELDDKIILLEIEEKGLHLKHRYIEFDL